jgi:hypothetical protein
MSEKASYIKGAVIKVTGRFGMQYIASWCELSLFFIFLPSLDLRETILRGDILLKFIFIPFPMLFL